MLYRRKIVFILLLIFIMSGLGSRERYLYYLGKSQFFFIIFIVFSLCILIHSHQKSQVFVERERDALKTHLSALVLTDFLVHDKPKIECFAIFSLVKITKEDIARYVCHRIVDSPHLAIHTSFCLTNHRKWIDLLKRSDGLLATAL